MKIFSAAAFLLAVTAIFFSVEKKADAVEPFSAPVYWGYGQIFLPPVNVVNPPPIYVGPTVTTYYNPPVYVNNYPPVFLPGPMIIRYPGHPFLRTFIP